MPKKKSKETTPCALPTKFRLFAADVSLRRPGFAMFTVDDHEVRLDWTDVLDNKTKKKPTGELLDDIINKLFELWNKDESDLPLVLVREKNFMNAVRAQATNNLLAEAIGICDWASWSFGYKGLTWEEIFPVSIKKLITGKGKAEKDEVAAALPKYVGPHEYKTDDESDAVAVGVAFLIKEGRLESGEEKELHLPSEK